MRIPKPINMKSPGRNTRSLDAQTVGEKPIEDGTAIAKAQPERNKTFALTVISERKTHHRKNPNSTMTNKSAKPCLARKAPSNGAMPFMPPMTLLETNCSPQNTMTAAHAKATFRVLRKTIALAMKAKHTFKAKR